MTTNVIVAVFKEMEKAIEASEKLMTLQSLGDISINEIIMLHKNLAGQSSVLKTETSNGIDTLVGASGGMIVGALAGPVGLLAGILLGGLTGSFFDHQNASLEKEFVKTIEDIMLPETSVIIMEVEEESIEFINHCINSLDGVFFRTSLKNVKIIHQKIKEIDKKIAFERKKISKASKESEATIKNNIEDYIQERKKIVRDINIIKDLESDIL